MKTLPHTRNALIFAIVLILVSTLLVGCTAEQREAKAALEKATADFTQAVETLDQKNASVDAAIADLQATMASEIRPLDESTVDAADAVISSAQAAKVTAPEMAEATEDIINQVNELNAVDYAAELEGIAIANTNLKNSIKQREQVTNPSEAFVIQRLSEVEHVLTPTAATEDNDPNGLLHKQGGYNVSVFFATDLFDANAIPESYGVGVVGRGVEGGGEVEVYEDEEGAIARDNYIATFDGTFIAPGSHGVCGTCVIRTSKELTATQQKELETAIIEALTRLE